jgi:hypothetical protein
MNKHAKITMTGCWLCRARSDSESLGKPDIVVDEAWYDVAEKRLAAYDRGEIPSVTLDEMIAARKGG